MKVFYLTSNNKEHLQILTDATVKKHIQTKLTWSDSLLLQLNDNIPSKLHSYISIKYGDYIKDIESIIVDRTPVMFVDYTPKDYKKIDKKT